MNGYLETGGCGIGVKAGESYVDVGTLNGYRTAITLLADTQAAGEGRPGPASYTALDVPKPSPAATGVTS